jgi:hypothetical protein
MNKQPILNLHVWVSLPNNVRRIIRNDFNIPCSGNVVVSDNRIETDGTSPKDFEALTVEKMQTYVNSDITDFHKLFDMVLVKVDNKIKGIAEPIINANPEENVKKTTKKSK